MQRLFFESRDISVPLDKINEKDGYLANFVKSLSLSPLSLSVSLSRLRCVQGPIRSEGSRDVQGCFGRA